MRTDIQKQENINLGTLAEQFVVNKINSLNNKNYSAIGIDEALQYKRSAAINHKEGDIYIVKNGLTFKIDIKSSVKNTSPVINIDAKDKNGKIYLKAERFLRPIIFDYYIGVGLFNNDPDDLNQKVLYTLLKTSEFKALLLDDPTHKFGLENYSKGKDINDSDYIFMNKFKGCKSYFESDNIEEILKRIV
jgi:hypothetical protein